MTGASTPSHTAVAPKECRWMAFQRISCTGSPIMGSPEGEKIPSYTIVTTDANKKMDDLHDRMPAMLLKEEWNEWLAPNNHDTNGLKGLLKPFPDNGIDYYQVSKAVNNVRNNSSDLVQAV